MTRELTLLRLLCPGGKALTLEQFAEKGMQVAPGREELKPAVQSIDLEPSPQPSRRRAQSSIGTRRSASQRGSQRGSATPDITGFDHLAFSRGGGPAASSIQPHAGLRSVRQARTPKRVAGSMDLLQLRANNDACAAVWGPGMQHYKPSRSLEGGALLTR